MSNEQLLIAAIVTLAGAVTCLFGLFRAEFRDVKRRLDDCEKDRRELWEQIGELKQHG